MLRKVNIGQSFNNKSDEEYYIPNCLGHTQSKYINRTRLEHQMYHQQTYLAGQWTQKMKMNRRLAITSETIYPSRQSYEEIEGGHRNALQKHDDESISCYMDEDLRLVGQYNKILSTAVYWRRDIAPDIAGLGIMLNGCSN